MVYDYYGFPDYTYQVHYDAPGDPALAARVKALLEAAGLPARLDGDTRLRSRRIHAAQCDLPARRRAGMCSYP